MTVRTAVIAFTVIAITSFALMLYVSLMPVVPDYVLFIRLAGLEYEQGRLLVLSMTPRGLVGSAYSLVPGWANYPIPLDNVFRIWLDTGEVAPVPSVTVGVGVKAGDSFCQTSFSIDSITLIVKHFYEEKGSVSDEDVVETYTRDPLAGFRFYPRLVVTITEEYMECRSLPEKTS